MAPVSSIYLPGARARFFFGALPSHRFTAVPYECSISMQAMTPHRDVTSAASSGVIPRGPGKVHQRSRTSGRDEHAGGANRHCKNAATTRASAHRDVGLVRSWIESGSIAKR